MFLCFFTQQKLLFFSSSVLFKFLKQYLGVFYAGNVILMLEILRKVYGLRINYFI